MYKELFNTITFGERKSYGAVEALPIYSPVFKPALAYLTLAEAMEQSAIKIVEVNEGGSVPDLKAVNSGKLPILLVSGEEVKGARQNRILNTSILLEAKSELVIPVSCTERGRWHYDSPDFKDSGNISSKDVRVATNLSVRHCLEMDDSFRSDQGQVWDKIEDLHRKSKSHDTSQTRAMDDAFQARATDLDEALRRFSPEPGQTGILFFLGGKVAGLDIISQPAAFARLHDKLVRSYVIDCLEMKEAHNERKTLLALAERFLASACNGTVKIFKSPGLGEDHRFSSPVVAGSSLVFQAEPVHTCAFRTKAEEQRMAGFSSRRDLF
jgi:hypothetical protein